MAGGLSARIAGIFAKKESSYGVDPTAAGTDAILVSNLSVTPYAGNSVSRDFLRTYFGASESINVGPHVQCSFDVEIAGSGTADTPPAYSALLQACGFSETVNAATDVTFDVISTSIPSVAIYYEANGETQKILGCRGSVSFDFSTGQIPKMSFSFTGLYAKPSASTLTPNFTAFQAPVPVTHANTTTLTLDSYAFLTEGLTFDIGNTVAYRNVVNGESVIISDRNVTGSLSVEAELLATKDVYAMIESHSSVSTVVLDLVHNATAGNIIEVDAPAVQITNFSIGESDGIKMYNLDFVCVPSSGNDEFVFITK